MLSLKPVPIAAGLLALAALAGFWTALSRPEAQIAHAISQAIGAQPASDSEADAFDRSHLHLSTFDPPEAFTPSTSPAAALATVAVGDRLSFTSGNGRTVSYAVTRIAALAGAGHQGAVSSRLMLVTAVAEDGAAAGEIRFVVQMPAASAPKLPHPAAGIKPHSL